MAIEEDGIWAVGVVWGLNAVVLLFVVLRIHNRVALKHAFGLDDAAFMISFGLLLGVSVLITISSHYGFGLSYTPYNDNTAKALFCESLGINFVGAGIVVIRCSLGLFLLRIFQERWQKLAIWGMIALLLLVMSVSTVLYWRECEPVAFLWDRRIKGAHCAGRFIPTSYAASAACVLADFFFALFPWLIIWRTNIKRRDRILVLSSLSLGVISGACGIARMTTMEGLTKPNLLKTSVYPSVLGIIELAVAIICSGIPMCLPFFVKLYDNWVSSRSASRNRSLGLQQEMEEFPVHGAANREIGLTEVARKFGVEWTGFESRIGGRDSDDEVVLNGCKRADSRNDRNMREN